MRDFILDGHGRLLCELPPGRLHCSTIEVVVGTVRGLYRHIGTVAMLSGSRPVGWKLDADGLDIVGPIFLPKDNDRFGRWGWGSTPADSLDHIGAVPPPEQRAPTWWSTDLGCMTSEGHRMVFCGTVIDVRQGQSLVETDLIHEWMRAPWQHPTGWVTGAYACGTRVALAVREGYLWTDAYVRPLAEVSLPAGYT